MNIKKIYIVGSPGSGKTTLASKLSKKLDVPHFDLDEIRFPLPSQKRPDEEAIPLVEDLTEKSSWIIEGVYITWVEPFLDKADQIIFLNTPFLVAFYRIVVRYIQNVLQGRSPHSFISTLVLLKNLILFHFFNQGEHVTRQQTVKVLRHHKNKLVIIQNGTDLKELLDNIL